MNRRTFFGATVGGLVGASLVGKAQPTRVATTGPFSLEIVSPPEEAVRELPLFDSYKQAQNFAQARMGILRQHIPGEINTMRDHEAGLIKVWSADNKVVFECAWGETWTASYSYVDANGRLI